MSLEESHLRSVGPDANGTPLARPELNPSTADRVAPAAGPEPAVPEVLAEPIPDVLILSEAEAASAVLVAPLEDMLPPPVRPGPGFWGSVLWCLLFVGVTQFLPAILVLCGVLVIHVAKDPQPAHALKELQNPEAVTALVMDEALAPMVAATTLSVVFFSWLVIRVRVGKDWKRLLGIRRPSVAQVLLGLVGLPALMVLATGLHELAGLVLPNGNYQQDLVKMFQHWDWRFGVLVVGLAPGVGEELWCRGFLGRGLVGRYGVVIGILLTSLFFGALHMDPPSVVATAAMGMCLHFTYLMSRSLLLPMFLHALNNSAGVLQATLFASDKAEEAAAQASTPHQAVLTAALYVAAALLLAAVAWALYRGRSRLLVAEGDGRTFWRPEFPGVEHPPRGSDMVVSRPWPGWHAASVVACALALFGAVLYLAAA